MKGNTWWIKAGMLGCIIWCLMAGARLALVWYQAPCLVSMDVRGKQMEVREVQQWMEDWNRGKRTPRIIGVSGWRWEKAREVYAPDTGRRHETAVIGVYGRVTEGMGFAGRLITGGWGLERDAVCLVSGSLAGALFGSRDVVGSRIRIGNEVWEIGGVMEGEEMRLIVPVLEGNVNWIEAWVDGKWRRPIKTFIRA